MPIKRPIVLEVKKRARVKVSWPHPPGVGDAIQEEWRKYEIPQDDYYYLPFSVKNTSEETKDNFKIIGEAGLPFEFSLSPSGCICYRLHRKYENIPEIQAEVGPKETVPVFMPGLQYNRKVEWRMYQQNALSFLFTSWWPVPSLARPIRQRRRQEEVRQVRQRKKQ